MIVERRLPSLVPVALHTVATPEEHRRRWKVTKEIISNTRMRLQAAILGQQHKFFFERADESFKNDLRYVFNAIDQNRDEQISVQELVNYLEKAGKGITQTEMNLLFESMDSDHSGTIDFEEFVELMSRHRALMVRYSRFTDYFIPIDANQDDRISKEEMNIALASVGEPPLSKSELLFIRNRMGDKPLTWNEFIQVLLVT